MVLNNNTTKVTRGLIIIILLASIHNFGSLVGAESIYSWGVLVFQLLALVLSAITIGSIYMQRGYIRVITFITLLFVLVHVFISGLEIVNIYYIYMIYLSPLVMYLLIRLSSTRDILFIFDKLSPVLAVVNLVPSVFLKGDLGYSGMLLTSSMFGMVSSLFAYVAFVKLFRKRNLENSIYFLLWAFVLMQTEHRTGMLALILASLTFVALSGKRNYLVRAFYILLGALFMISLAFVVLKYSNLEIVNKMFYDGKVSFENINFSGRLFIWRSLLDGYISSSGYQQIFGNGIGSTTAYIAQHHSDTVGDIAVSHNEYIRLFFEYGIFGAVLYILIIYNIFSLRTSFAIGLPILVHYGVEMMFSNVLFSGPFYLFILIIGRRYLGEIEPRNHQVQFVVKSHA